MDAMYANLQGCGFSLFLDHYFDFLLRLLYHISFIFNFSKYIYQAAYSYIIYFFCEFINH